MDRDDAAKTSWDKVYREFAENDAETMVSAIIDRGDVFMRRFQELFALSENSLTIKAEHVRAAAALWKYCEDSARYLFGARLGDAKAEKIFDGLRRSPQGLTRWDISNVIFKRNVKTRAIDEALKVLIQAKWIESRVEKTSGRDAERFFPKK